MDFNSSYGSSSTSESDSLPVSSAAQSTKVLWEPIKTPKKWKWKKFFHTMRFYILPARQCITTHKWIQTGLRNMCPLPSIFLDPSLDGIVNSPARRKPKNPVQDTAQSMNLTRWGEGDNHTGFKFTRAWMVIGNLGSVGLVLCFKVFDDWEHVFQQGHVALCLV